MLKSSLTAEETSNLLAQFLIKADKLSNADPVKNSELFQELDKRKIDFKKLATALENQENFEDFYPNFLEALNNFHAEKENKKDTLILHQIQQNNR